MAGHTLAYFGRSRWRRSTSPLPRKAAQVPTDFFGLCVANAPDPACDDYVIARLNELGIRHARLDFTYGDRDAFTERFLARLLTDRFRVCLHLVQPREEAHTMLRHPEAAERWRAFVGDMLDRYGSRVELIEIGATCNRRKWSGYSPAAFFVAWQIAWEEARGRNLAIAGPNVTDFEPAYNAGWLGEFRRSRVLPSVHTDNLFVERATEPEAFDHKIAGQRLASLFRFNLVRKAQLLQDIGAWAGVPTLMCAHVTWSLRRIARFLEDVEEKQADYLGRYACLAAASGALTRVYWGPLIGQREGLIDDGTLEYPELPHVTYYEQARGEIKDYRLRPAFRTFQTVNRLLAGATFQRRLATDAGLEILEFVLNAECQAPPERYAQASRMQNAEEKSQRSEVSGQRSAISQKFAPPLAGSAISNSANAESGMKNEEQRTRNGAILHAVWTTDGNGASADACYPPELLAQAEIYARDGQRLERAPRMFSESPVFILWPSGVCHPSSGVCLPIPGYRFAHRPGWDFDIVRVGTNALGLGGVYLTGDGGERVDIQALLELAGHGKAGGGEEKQTPNAQHPTPNAQCRMPDPASPGGYAGQAPDGEILQSKIENRKSKILRDSRNVVWSVSAPWDIARTIVIKEFKPRSVFRRLLDYGKPDKALRSWNGAQELLRRGLQTPTPLACLIPGKTAPGNAKYCAASYYICEAFAPAWSARDAFNAFSAGATEFQGQTANTWYGAIAVFLQKLHTRGVYFRDLSAGNLLVRQSPAGELEFALIDTARARFYPYSLNLRPRFCDLMRICHPLNWPNRRIFVEQYLAHNGRRFSWWMKIPFWYYDGKHRAKNALKKIRL
ncbi:MAG: lipopolysaccharide kinase InaA family protein [Verrucomicrobia bacterium]|nr:lipopolysaccharide kinase InaA family protein [Verrucomicrobiota bacterium]